MLIGQRQQRVRWSMNGRFWYVGEESRQILGLLALDSFKFSDLLVPV